MIREAGPADYEAWTRVRNLVEAGDPSTVEELARAVRQEPERRLFLAERGGEPLGCAFVGRSSVPGRAFVLPRVVPGARRGGLGAALLQVCAAAAQELELEVLRSSLDEADLGALAFAARFCFAEVDRQVELLRELRPDEAEPVLPEGIELASSPAGLKALVRPLLASGVADMPVVGGIDAIFVEEVLEDFRRAIHVVVALGPDGPVGIAGLLPYGARREALEHAFTTVAREARGRGIAVALKQACVQWAAAHGYRELVTWTQQGNGAMQAVNERAGFRAGSVSVTVEAPLHVV